MKEKDRIYNNRDQTTTLTKDGRWVPATPLPYYRDTRPWYLRAWHFVLGVRFAMKLPKDLSADERLDKVEGYLAELEDPYMVPVEPYKGKDGN